MLMDTLLEESVTLPIEERVKLVEDIWDSIASEREFSESELSAPQNNELERRVEYHRQHPGETISWAEARARVLTPK